MSAMIGRRSLAGLALVPLAGAASGSAHGITLDFTKRELEALALSARLLARSPDPLSSAASAALDRLSRQIAADSRPRLGLAPDFDLGAGEGEVAALRPIAEALDSRRVLRLLYCDVEGVETVRTVWPVAVIGGPRGRLLAGHCALRGQFRHFRLDRVIGLHVGAETIPQGRAGLLEAWMGENRWRSADIVLA
jgi:predicted DNA-binding transcriptional regulator YafY